MREQVNHPSTWGTVKQFLLNIFLNAERLKMKELPEALPAWMYCNPLEIIERLHDVATADARKAVRDRAHKHRRVAALTRKALQK